jgi:hypothetical protein
VPVWDTIADVREYQVTRDVDALAKAPLPKSRQAPEISSVPGRELADGLHLHFHGVSAEDVAEILRRELP